MIIRGKILNLPTFFPDGTKAVVRGVDSTDLVNCGVKGMVMSTYHLMNKLGVTTIKQAGGIKSFMNWEGFVITDSGGFQIFSLVHEGSIKGQLSKKGWSIIRNGKKQTITPEKIIEAQFNIGSDIIIALDDCPGIDAKDSELREAVERTIEWAKRSKVEYEKQIKTRKISEEMRPVIFGVIQGGNNKELRKECADALKQIGFDGYGFGGWPMSRAGEYDYEILKFTAEQMEDGKPKYALGIGNPQAIVECSKMGYNIFDCVLPTRDARHKRLYILKEGIGKDNLSENFYEYMYIDKEKYTKDYRKISENCNCFTCRHYTRGYLHHLFEIKETLAIRLATIHNLYFYQQLISLLK